MIPLHAMVAGDEEEPAEGLPRAATIASQWLIDANSLQIWRYSANFLYTVTIQGALHYLRVAPASERTPERLAQEVALLDWLQAQGWNVPVAIPTRDGHRVATTIAGEDTYHAFMWSDVPGNLRELEDLTTADLETWGAALGRLHTTLQHAPPNARPGRTAWHVERDLILAALPVWQPEVRVSGEMSGRSAADREIGVVTSLTRPLPAGARLGRDPSTSLSALSWGSGQARSRAGARDPSTRSG